jgi:hypothetical protein
MSCQYTDNHTLYSKLEESSNFAEGDFVSCVPHLLLNLFQQFICSYDTIVFAESVAFVLDIDVAIVAGINDNLQHTIEVNRGLIALFVEVIALGADSFGEGHQHFDGCIFIRYRWKIAEVGQCPAIRQADFLNDSGKPLAVG